MLRDYEALMKTRRGDPPEEPECDGIFRADACTGCDDYDLCATVDDEEERAGE